MKRITKNSIKCNLCQDIIVSKHTHDFVSCKCGCCSADGGNSYLKRSYTYSIDDFTELSEYEDIEEIVENKDISKRIPNIIK